MMKKFKHILIPVFVIASGIVAFAASPKLRSMVLPAEKAASPRPAIVFPEYDMEADSLFSELAALYNRAGQLKSCLIEGNIRLVDQADSSHSMSTRFRYCQRDSLCYYQLGDQEMLTLPGLYMSVDHTVRKIMLSPNPQPANVVKPMIGQEQVEALKLEGYYITKEMNKPYTVIRLRREKHVSCREFRVTYDSAGMIRSTFMRNSDMSAPEDLSLDKLITVNILNWQTSRIPEHLFRAERFIQRDGELWVPTAPFKDYEIKYIY